MQTATWIAEGGCSLEDSRSPDPSGKGTRQVAGTPRGIEGKVRWQTPYSFGGVSVYSKNRSVKAMEQEGKKKTSGQSQTQGGGHFLPDYKESLPRRKGESSKTKKKFTTLPGKPSPNLLSKSSPFENRIKMGCALDNPEQNDTPRFGGGAISLVGTGLASATNIARP